MAHQILANDLTWTINTDEPAWHGIDKRIAPQSWDSPEWREPFAWSPEISVLQYINPVTGRENADPYRALVRSDDGSLLSVVGSEAEHRSYLETIDRFRDLTSYGYRLATGGTLRGGKTAYLTLAAPEDLTLPDGSMLRPYLALLLSQCGRADVVKHTAVRIVCANTEALALGEEAPEIRIRHSSNYQINRDLAADLVCAAGNVGAVTVAEYQRQAKHRVSEAQATEIFESILGKAPVESPTAMGRYRNKLDLFRWAYTQAPGAAPGSMWGVMQAVTYVASHETGKGKDKGGAASRLLDGGAAQALIRKGSAVVSLAMAA
jgi:phage/plasmid-like protein (TIGR03299 family)